MQQTPQTRFETINLLSTPTLIISKEILSIITYLHSKEKVEWSGALFHSVVSGSIDEPASLVLKAEYLHLMDIGSAAYTEFDMTGESFFRAFENNPILEDKMMSGEWMAGFLHTHHTMQTNPSGTDTDELLSNCVNFPYYLSLIVNYSGNYSARIAIKGKYKKKITENAFSFNSIGGIAKRFAFKDEDEDKDVIAVLNCNIKFNVDQSIENQYEHIKSQTKKSPYTYPTYGTYIAPENKISSSAMEQSDLKFSDFLAGWILNEKKHDSSLYMAITEFGKLFRKCKKTDQVALIDRKIVSFKSYVHSNISKNPSKEELDAYATRAKSYLTGNYKSESGILELVEALGEYIIPNQNASIANRYDRSDRYNNYYQERFNY